MNDRLASLMARKTAMQVGDDPLPLPQSDENRVSTAIVRYCNAAADEIEKEVARVNERVAKFNADAHKTAANLREIGQAQCDHILAFSATVKNAVESMRDTGASLLNYMTPPGKPVRRPDVIEAVAKELNGGTELPAGTPAVGR